MKQVELYKLLADDNRLKIFTLLLYKELCICDLEIFLNMKQANVSKHMMKFKKLNIVDIRKDSKWVYYQINNDFINNNNNLIRHIKEKATINKEISLLLKNIEQSNTCNL